MLRVWYFNNLMSQKIKTQSQKVWVTILRFYMMVKNQNLWLLRWQDSSRLWQMQIPEHASNWANQHGWQIVIINVTTNYCKWNVNNSSILGLVGRGISWRRVGPLLLRISWIDLTLRTNCSARLIIHLYRQWGMIPGTAPAGHPLIIFLCGLSLQYLWPVVLLW